MQSATTYDIDGPDVCLLASAALEQPTQCANYGNPAVPPLTGLNHPSPQMHKHASDGARGDDLARQGFVWHSLLRSDPGGNSPPGSRYVEGGRAQALLNEPGKGDSWSSSDRCRAPRRPNPAGARASLTGCRVSRLSRRRGIHISARSSGAST